MKHLLMIGLLFIGVVSYAHTVDHTATMPKVDATINVIDNDHAMTINATPIERKDGVNVSIAGIECRPLELATYGTGSPSGSLSIYVAPRYHTWLPANEVPPNGDERT